MFSHHSHSGDYVAHASDTLEAVVGEALRQGFHTYCLTEHMPRLDEAYLYPEEQSGEAASDLRELAELFERYVEHAERLRQRVGGMAVLVGMEAEACDRRHVAYAKRLLQEFGGRLQFCVGSVHHVYGIPIDYDQAMWGAALQQAGGNLKRLLADYFDWQYYMLCELQPQVVGHFDLIRLYLPRDKLWIELGTGAVSDTYLGSEWAHIAAVSSRIVSLWEDVQSRVVRNLKYIASYGGLVEINSAGLRKGLADPYPHRDVALLVKEYAAARFVLSDDAHSVSQVGTEYARTLEYVENVLQLEGLFYLAEGSSGPTVLEARYMTLQEIKESRFWK
ncbi:AaceriAEL022Wp [[Ashbya] aceris (nom. inval.)]|nr:AaceriAEL022Wp [[Ashbya] aceris (nom. inval.)]